jgi:hypothetical protein
MSNFFSNLYQNVFLWCQPSSQSENKIFIDAITENLIDTKNVVEQGVKLPLYRASKIKYFDRNDYYPISKIDEYSYGYAPIWFALSKQSVIFYARTYGRNSPVYEDNIIILEYKLKPNRKILKIRNEYGQINNNLMKIIVDHVINKIINDKTGIKKNNIIDKIKKSDDFIHLRESNDSIILNEIFNIFRGIYTNNRTGIKLVDELLFQEIINEMICLNLIETFNIVGFWIGFTLIDGPDPIEQEIIIIDNQMRDCLKPLKIYSVRSMLSGEAKIILNEDEYDYEEGKSEELLSEKNTTQQKFKKVNVETSKERREKKTIKDKNKRETQLNKNRIQLLNTNEQFVGGIKNKNKNKNKKNRTKKIKNELSKTKKLRSKK